jgi:hypothetical protein
MNTSYTIDVSTRDGAEWRWLLYTNGGALRLTEATAPSFEQALDDAKRNAIVHHRSGEVAQ